jgi:hypothetical protein
MSDWGVRFAGLWEGGCKGLQGFGKGVAKACRSVGRGLQRLARVCERGCNSDWGVRFAGLFRAANTMFRVAHHVPGVNP